jgi:hypothetical protein
MKPNLNRQNIRLPLLLGLLILTASTAAATMVPRMDLSSLTTNSERILHGTVVKRWSAWGESGRHIWTHYEIQISDVLKGVPQATFTLSEPGGMVGDTGMSIAGVPEFDLGDEVVVFSFRTPAGYWRVRGYGQGKYNVTTQENGARTVRNSPGEIVLIDPSSRTTGRVNLSAPTGNGMRLEQFKSLVRSMIAAQGGN